jgi:nitrate reductase beta subunit
MRSVMRERNLGAEPDAARAREVGLDPGELERLYRLLALAHYHERYVIPQGHAEVAGPLVAGQGGGGFPKPLAQATTGSSTFIPLGKVGRIGS